MMNVLMNVIVPNNNIQKIDNQENLHYNIFVTFLR